MYDRPQVGLPGVFACRPQGGRDLGRVVSVIVDDGDFVVAVPNPVADAEAAVHALESVKSGLQVFECDAELQAHRDCSKGVFDVVPAGHSQAHATEGLVVPYDGECRLLAGGLDVFCAAVGGSEATPCSMTKWPERGATAADGIARSGAGDIV